MATRCADAVGVAWEVRRDCHAGAKTSSRQPQIALETQNPGATGPKVVAALCAKDAIPPLKILLAANPNPSIIAALT